MCDIKMKVSSVLLREVGSDNLERSIPCPLNFYNHDGSKQQVGIVTKVIFENEELIFLVKSNGQLVKELLNE